MKKCPTCHQEVNEGDRFCLHCGAALNMVECPKCHHLNDAKNTFCVQCGSSLQARQEVEEDTPIIINEAPSEIITKKPKMESAKTVFFWVAFGLTCLVFLVFLSTMFLEWVDLGQENSINAMAYYYSSTGTVNGSFVDLFRAIPDFLDLIAMTDYANFDLISVGVNIFVNAISALLIVCLMITLFVTFLVSIIRKKLTIERMLKQTTVMTLILAGVCALSNLDGAVIDGLIATSIILLIFLITANTILTFKKDTALNLVGNFIALGFIFLVFTGLGDVSFTAHYYGYFIPLFRFDGLAGFLYLITSYGFDATLITISYVVTCLTYAILFTVVYQTFTEPYEISLNKVVFSFVATGLSLASFILAQSVNIFFRAQPGAVGYFFKASYNVLAYSPFFIVIAAIFQAILYANKRKADAAKPSNI